MKSRGSKLDTWTKSPPKYFVDVLGCSLEPYQDRVSLEIAKHDKVVIRATHSVGKTWILARIALWFFSCYRNSIIITTAPTSRQVKTLLWGEIRDAYKKSKVPIGGRLLDVSLKYSDKWYAMGFTTNKKAGDSSSKEQVSSSFQGFHSDYILIIFDEATGIEQDIWTMAEGLMTSGKIVKFVAIANPTSRNTRFHECFSDYSFKKIHISCFDSPNLAANGFSDKEALVEEVEYLKLLSEDARLRRINKYSKPVTHLLSAQWVVSRLLKWGFDHPLSLSKIFGEFPDHDDTVLIQYQWVVDAMGREIDISADDKRCIGVDVARMGPDTTVFTDMVGMVHQKTIRHKKRDIVFLSTELVEMIKESSRKTIVAIDGTGIGAGLIDNLNYAKEQGILSKDVEIVEIHFAQSPVDKALLNKEMKTSDDLLRIEELKSRYANLKARMFDLLSQDLRDNISILDEEIYLEELPTIKMIYDSKGKLLVESKDDYKKRTGRDSPDDMDSLALANFARHLDLGYGFFNFDKDKTTKPMVRQSGIKPRKKTIKVTQY